MNRHRVSVMSTMAMLSLVVAVPSAAVAQTAKDLVGTWMTVSNFVTRQDGRKVEGLTKGILVFDASGRFVSLSMRPGLPKFASNNRETGTPEENRAIVHGSLGSFGSYSIADKVVTLKTEASTFPGLEGTEQKRTISAFTGDELTWTFRSLTSVGTNEQSWRRAK
jgi:hypothetical protein